MKPLTRALLTQALPASLIAVMPVRAQDAPTPAPAAPRSPMGWLSDPKQPPDSALDALASGKIHLDNNLRFEYADTTGRRSSNALTNRLRLGYETKPFYGFSGMVEMENVATPDTDTYWVPATGDGSPSRTVIADPPGTEVNRVWARYKIESIGNTGVSADIKAGRQRIKLDDDRFVGNVGWRQFELTYDSASVRTNLGADGLDVFYAYVWGVQRIFGPDGPNFDSDTHLLNASYRVAPELKVTPFAYWIDFEGDDPINSNQNYGLRLTGNLWKGAGGGSDFFADYELTYAYQSDAGSNPIDYSAHFLAAQFRVTQTGLGHALAGYQFLGSDDGAIAFRFPLGTNHAFQGFADNFLVTPAAGLQDLYLGLGADLPLGIKAAVTFHQFWSDEGGRDLGYEVDAVASKQLTPQWSVLAKAAHYDGDSGQPDTTRLWVQTTFRF